MRDDAAGVYEAVVVGHGEYLLGGIVLGGFGCGEQRFQRADILVDERLRGTCRCYLIFSHGDFVLQLSNGIGCIVRSGSGNECLCLADCGLQGGEVARHAIFVIFLQLLRHGSQRGYLCIA